MTCVWTEQLAIRSPVGGLLCGSTSAARTGSLSFGWKYLLHVPNALRGCAFPRGLHRLLPGWSGGGGRGTRFWLRGSRLPAGLQQVWAAIYAPGDGTVSTFLPCSWPSCLKRRAQALRLLSCLLVVTAGSGVVCRRVRADTLSGRLFPCGGCPWQHTRSLQGRVRVPFCRL